MKRIIPILACIAALQACSSAPEPFGALPSPAQLEWQGMETNMFIHFGPNTFSGAEWGDGTESEDIFNPSQLDCSQWVSVARAAGFKGIIITAKHHDGFCLWPNPESAHTVAQSSWRNGHGDVLRELSDACREGGLKFGVYVSPWDRNHPAYGTDEYNGVFVRTLEHIYSNYGDIFEQWFDGACGEGPNGKRQQYDWPLFNSTVAALEPRAVIFSDAGPGCRWVGNETGRAGRTNWSTIDRDTLFPGKRRINALLNEGAKGAKDWIPAETDVSIRPGWFWRASETPSVKSVQQLLKIWYESVGRNSLLLLNVPPDERGLIDPADSVRLVEWRSALDEILSCNLAEGASATASSTRGSRFRASNALDGDPRTYWAAGDGVREAELRLRLDGARTFNRLLIQEYIPLGQRVESFEVLVPSAEGWETVARETTIGYKRIVLLPEVTASELIIRITGALACPAISNIELYHDKIYRNEEI